MPLCLHVCKRTSTGTKADLVVQGARQPVRQIRVVTPTLPPRRPAEVGDHVGVGPQVALQMQELAGVPVPLGLLQL